MFGFSLDEFIYFGLYSGPAELIGDDKRWKAYIRDSIIEPSLTKDIHMLTPIQKPVLLRHLSDAGNTTTLTYYLDLLRQCGLLARLQKYSGSEVRKRVSGPKLQVLNTSPYTMNTLQLHLK